MDEEEWRQLVLERFEEALSVTEEAEEDAFLTYPSVGDRPNVHYEPGQGLLPVKTLKLFRISGDFGTSEAKEGNRQVKFLKVMPLIVMSFDTNLFSGS